MTRRTDTHVIASAISCSRRAFQGALTRAERLAPYVRRSTSTGGEPESILPKRPRLSAEEEYVTRRRRSVALSVVVASLCLASPAGAAFPGSNGDIAFVRRGSIRIVSPGGTIGARIGPT